MAYEFSVALRASCALVTRMTLAHGVYRRVENCLTALMVRSTGADSVVFRGGLPGLGRNRDVAIGHSQHRQSGQVGTASELWVLRRARAQRRLRLASAQVWIGPHGEVTSRGAGG